MLLHSRDPYPFGLATTPPLPTAVSQMTTNRPDLDATTLLLADQCFLQHQPNNATPRLTGSCGSGSESSTATTFDLVPQSSFATEIGNGGKHPYLLPSHLSDPPLDHVGSQLTHEHENTRVARLGSPLNCPQPLLCFDGSEILQQHSNTNNTEIDYVTVNGESKESAFVFRCGGNDTRKEGTNSLSASEHDVRDTSLDELYSGCMEFVRPATDGHVFEELQSNPLDPLLPFDTPSDPVDIRRDKVSGKFKNATHHNTEHSGANSEKRCKVCGDRAVNHNFGQLTCESCKAFFRRNAHKLLPSLLDRTFECRSDIDMTTVQYSLSLSRSKYLVELTCTSKTGEHEITPSTRRECPACRLKKCFLVGMRPDLIQVRKKDGSKPRWLDKVPSAAIVHEKHLQSNELQGKSVWMSTSKLKSQNTGRITKHASSKESREDVCSTDSGSCLSMDVTSHEVSHPYCQSLQKTDNPDLFDLGVVGLVSDTLSAVDQAESDKSNNEERKQHQKQQHQYPSDRFVQLNYDICPIGQPALDLQSSVQSSTDVQQEQQQQQQQELLHRQPNAVGLSERPTGSVLVTPNTRANISVVHLSPKPANLIPTVAVATVGPYSNADGLVPNLAQSPEYPFGNKCPVAPTTVTSMNHNALNTLEDFILVTNTPRLLVPTNVVTIGAATTVTTNTQDVITAEAVPPTPRTIGLGVNLVHMSHPNLSPRAPYTQYPQHGPEKPSVQSSPSPNAHPAEPQGQTILTSLWSPSSTHGIQTSNLIPVANNTTDNIVPTLVPSFSNCVLTTPIQSLSPQTTTLINSTHMLNNSFTLAGSASIRLPVDTVPSTVGTVALTAILPSSSPQIIRPENLFPNQSTLLLSNTAEPPIIVAQAPQSVNCPTSYIGVFSQTTDWSVSPTASVQAGIIPKSSPFKIPEARGFSDNNCPQASAAEVYWRLSPMDQIESCISQSSPLIKKKDQSDQLPTSCRNMPPTVRWTAQTDCSLRMVSRAWNAMWHEGIWPNPKSVNLDFGTESFDMMDWRSSIASLWTDVFLRRISTFAVHLFCSLCGKTPTDAMQSLIAEAQTEVTAETGSEECKTAGDEQVETSWITWNDVLWMAEHRFIDCIPILLISCLQCSPRYTDSMHVTSVSLPTRATTQTPDFGATRLCVSTGPEELASLIPSRSASQARTKLENLDTNPSRSMMDPNFSVVWSSADPLRSNSMNFMQATEAPNIPVCEPGGCHSTVLLDMVDAYEASNETTVHFECEPGGHAYLSLSNLSSALAKIQTDVTKHSQRGHSSYPILQYLDSYVLRFGSFLAYHPVLLSAFIALKLTDPGESRPNEQVDPAILSEMGKRERRIRRLNEQFITVFSNAADLVALDASQNDRESRRDPYEHTDVIHIKPEELDAANSRRAMLNDFLAWSRTFDSAWREFQRNTWVQLAHGSGDAQTSTLHRLTTFYAQDGRISQQYLLNLLLESLNELQ
ncbi:hypothetical protein CRM22_005548 [Opisthorchis felineus]|uniref:Nuclear receptor domain-containing protein n=1 Tax=Opisthorchis felineus TaxID=147828 RepID=A0A4S2LRY5_OPIFE|nr:hypothetical protein CRM22_005548 [Opisthorchis felineus]